MCENSAEVRIGNDEVTPWFLKQSGPKSDHFSALLSNGDIDAKSPALLQMNEILRTIT